MGCSQLNLGEKTPRLSLDTSARHVQGSVTRNVHFLLAALFFSLTSENSRNVMALDIPEILRLILLSMTLPHSTCGEKREDLQPRAAQLRPWLAFLKACEALPPAHPSCKVSAHSYDGRQ